ncbi:MAG: hypothetical protein OXR68_04860 [Alphaproteobacteria bacterium]|nr:hypothetical protein [Alphaproteobacteria bacterium]MDD9919937.1 hypothetical protein [Alphaproteobacteria bacterium]
MEFLTDIVNRILENGPMAGQLAELFIPAAASIGIFKIFSTLYLKGVFGLGAATRQLPGWDDEIEGWLISLIVILGTLGRVLFAGNPIAWALGVAALLIVGSITLIRLMFHDLPRWLAWTLTVLMLGIPLVLGIVGAVLMAWTGWVALLVGLAVFFYALFFALLIAAAITLIYKISRALGRLAGNLWHWLFGTEPAKDSDIKPHRARVWLDDPQLGIPDKDKKEPETEDAPRIKDAFKLAANSCMIVDFLSPVIQDHYGPDLRLIRAPVDQDVTVEVSNDQRNWEPCTRDKTHAGFEDYDVPYGNSPWRYVRICNKGKKAINVYGVHDLY